MEIPNYQPSYIDSAEALLCEVERLGLSIPFQTDLSILADSLAVGDVTIPNRFCAQPIFGCDAQANGAPSSLTRRRYRRYASGGFGLIWMERTSALTPRAQGGLTLSKTTVREFASMLEEMRAAASARPAVILQLAAEEPAACAAAAGLAAEAGFDGVDVQGALATLPEMLAGVRAAAPTLLRSTRLCVYEAVRGGFGAYASDYRQYDLTGPLQQIRQLMDGGLQLLNVTSSSPCLRGKERGERARLDSDSPDEHPLMVLTRQLALVRGIRERISDLPLVGSGWSWLRQFVPQVASGAVAAGWLDFAGLGRAALAYPDLPARVLGGAAPDAAACCMVCFACSQLQRAGREVGCVLRDPDFYGPTFREVRRLDEDRLQAGAVRCHLCEAAPCSGKSPTHTDIPSFIKAFREGREQAAYEVIRRANPLPELTSQTGPSWMEEEGACIEKTLTGTPVPIQDLQYALAWRARDRGESGVRVPEACSRARIAIVGGGPTGIAAASRLVELGHRVHILESSSSLGGAPVRVLAKHRAMADPREEIDALLRPAIAAGRLQISYEKTLGGDVSTHSLLSEYDAVLVAVGLWRERSLGKAAGVIGALELLEHGLNEVPGRVAVLAGGDSAMDACSLLRSSGAAEIFVIYGGPRSELHWHMPESWFASPGVHALMNCVPQGYESDAAGRVSGVRLKSLDLGVEVVLAVDLVVEAMGLEVAENIVPEVTAGAGRIYTAGALINGGTSVGHCIAEGLATAEAIHNNLQNEITVPKKAGS